MSGEHLGYFRRFKTLRLVSTILSFKLQNLI